MKPTHSPTPWAVHGTTIYTASKVENSEPGFDPCERLVAACPDSDCGSDYTAKDNLGNYEEAAANAGRIALAVNNHDALVEALRRLVGLLTEANSPLLMAKSAQPAIHLLAKLEAGK